MEKKNLNMKKQWAKCVTVLVLYLLFLLWVKSWLGLIVVPFIFDVYITKKIKWQWWKNSEPPVRFIMSWVDAIVFALVAVYFINLFFFQNYVIPSSSLEKSLLTGDYLFVSKVSYGPRIPETPLTMPLTQHTLPVLKCKSGAQRHRRIQLSGRRHAREQRAIPGRRLLPDVLLIRLSAAQLPARNVQAHPTGAV